MSAVKSYVPNARTGGVFVTHPYPSGLVRFSPPYE